MVTVAVVTVGWLAGCIDRNFMAPPASQGAPVLPEDHAEQVAGPRVGGIETETTYMAYTCILYMLSF